MVSRLSDVAAGLLAGLIFGAIFSVLFPPVVPSVSGVAKPACSPTFELTGEAGVFGCIKGAELNGNVTFVPCTGPIIEVPVASVRTSKFTCADEAGE